ncbi:glycosyltransferase involved in cell wall biosynthesis [Ancylobacter aquaticus]|uniref:Glycosyltransferase involved in cell wall biosynthesis n=1 Tax=Ancylobacter aquaticus TaxID=100 RepID=A0A4V2PI81_ANCAQ|nr:glycosyltransferase family 4 protein [Ancylobacter aquaticus]TCK23596.1 glycosyltransferase involved in cell wall biosynthesis [Ancylobacter aquaticus]
MSAFAFAIPGDISLPTGGYAYDRRVMAEAPRAGGALTHVALPGGFPFPSPTELERSAEILRALPPGQPVLIDGLALGALPAPLLRGVERPLAALVHHPLALESGLNEGQRAELFASERAALAQVSAVIATSPSTARCLAREYGVPAERLSVAVPGTDPGLRASGTGRPLRLLAVGAVIPRKAHGVLVEALAGLNAHDWTCHIVGATDRDPDETARVAARIATHGLGARVRLTGALSPERLAGEFDAADLFVTASLFEGYGMGLTEALAHGLPIVATRAGAIPDTVPAEASLLAEPGDVASLAEALRLLFDEPDRRAVLAQAAWHHGQSLPTWMQTAAVLLAALKEMPR